MTQTLTREQVLAMEPGRELDELIITRVLGLQIVNHEEVTYDWVDSPENYPYVSRGSLSKTNLMKWLEPDEDGFIIEPSTDFSAAWEVVSVMRKKNWNFVASTEGEDWEATFYWDANRTGFEAKGVGAPEAICKAALLAVLDI